MIDDSGIKNALKESCWRVVGMAKKKRLFVSCNSPKKNRVGSLVKLFFVLFVHYFFGQKCVFYAGFTLIGSQEG